MIILDTQHISQLQLTGTTSESRLASRLRAVPREELRITIISQFEQLRECFGRINASGPQPAEQFTYFELLSKLMDYYASNWWRRILPSDQAAAGVMSQFTPQLIRRIGPRDSRIAAIVLANRGTLLSANLRDFQQVPGLLVDAWLRD